MGCLEHQEKPKSALLASLKDPAQPVPQAERCWQRQVKGSYPSILCHLQALFTHHGCQKVLGMATRCFWDDATDPGAGRGSFLHQPS